MTWVRVDVVMDPDVRAAIGLSTLQGLPQEVLARLTAGATKASVRAGLTIHGEGEAEPHLQGEVDHRTLLHVPPAIVLTKRDVHRQVKRPK